MKKLSLLTILLTLLAAPLFGQAEAATAEASAEAAAETATVAPRVELKTTLGKIILELDPVKAPQSVENFLAYVESGFYNGTIFHRVIPGFMAQGGGFTIEMQKKQTNAPIENEADNGLRNYRGTVAMARTGDPHSATAQFFINTVDNAFLNHKSKTRRDWGYTVFGKVVDGMAVVDAIEKVRTANRGPMQNVPVEPVIIESAQVLPGPGEAE